MCAARWTRAKAAQCRAPDRVAPQAGARNARARALRRPIADGVGETEAQHPSTRGADSRSGTVAMRGRHPGPASASWGGRSLAAAEARGPANPGAPLPPWPRASHGFPKPHAPPTRHRAAPGSVEQAGQVEAVGHRGCASCAAAPGVNIRGAQTLPGWGRRAHPQAPWQQLCSVGPAASGLPSPGR